MTNIVRRSMTIDGFTLSYFEREAVGPAGEAPILLLHGLIATAETFGALMTKLPKNRRVLAMDFPGAGHSQRSHEADVSFAGMARFVAKFITKAGLERPVLLGHSHGGAVSMTLAEQQPELLSGLILMAPAHPFSGYEMVLVNFYLSMFGRMLARMLPWMPMPAHRIALQQMTGPNAKCDPSTLQMYRRSGKVPGTVENLLRMLGSWQSDMNHLREDLLARPISLPTLILWGDHDRVVPESTAPSLERWLTNWEHVTLPGIGHLPSEEAPEECSASISDWLVHLGRAAKRAPEARNKRIGAVAHHPATPRVQVRTRRLARSA